MVTTVTDLIDRLGGTEAVGSLCGGIGKTAISHWRVQNRIPDRHKFRLFQECKARGLTVDPAIFDESGNAGVVDDELKERRLTNAG